jgi:LPXTG-motif cell wall-anchored protein
MRWKLIPLVAGAIFLFGASAAYAADQSATGDHPTGDHPTTPTTPTIRPDFGPPPGAVHISCDEVGVDPPFSAIVTHHITVNGVPHDRTVVYGATTPGFAVAGISDLTSEVGVTYVITDYATWNLGSGRTPTFSATRLCHPAPPTSTPGSTTPSTTPVTQAGGHTEPVVTTVVVGGISAVRTDAGGTGGSGNANPTGGTNGSLPFTGDNHVGLLTALGAGLLAAGGIAASRKRRVET